MNHSPKVEGRNFGSVPVQRPFVTLSQSSQKYTSFLSLCLNSVIISTNQFWRHGIATYAEYSLQYILQIKQNLNLNLYSATVEYYKGMLKPLDGI